jgi:hypothetical protein
VSERWYLRGDRFRDLKLCVSANRCETRLDLVLRALMNLNVLSVREMD